ncbi:MAG: reductive dehalogenase [Candidatus Zixiibacteriota bacterium]|nr:MAG: reductive dehalogenase [candidate division Zixibacteria bacterium]
MNMLTLIFILIGGAICLLFGFFAVGSVKERKSRASAVCVAACLFFALLWLGGLLLFSVFGYILVAVTILAAVFGALFFSPLGTSEPLRIGAIESRVDERDIMFAREEYQPGSEKHEQYYAMRPEYRDIDDRIRSLPEFLAPGGRFYDEEKSRYIGAVFKTIRDMTTRVDGTVHGNRAELDASDATGIVKNLAMKLGASEVGTALLNPMHVYSHVGRGPEPWGAPIENTHKYAIAFTIEMDYFAVNTAPQMPTTEESAIQYLNAASISVALARFIRTLGYPARAHISDSNYQIMLPPVAHDAGLGELGRIGYLISPKYGARIRLGAVTTDLPLVPNRPITFGVQDFCKKCLKCAVNCPSGAIPEGNKTLVRGVEKWLLDVVKCIHYWRVAGTDCGICMKVCPFSHPPTFVHNLVRTGIQRSSFARTVSVWGDDLFYGK